jgi:transposase
VVASWRASREKLIEELERQERENEQLRRERDRYRQERDRLRKKIERLEDDLDEARRALHRQAAPFSRGTPRRRPCRPGRKAGVAYGRKAHRPVPRQIDECHAAPLPARCPDCGGRLTTTRHATQYQEDLPAVRPVVRAFDIAIGRCADCGRRVQGRHSLQTSNAIGAAGTQLGPATVTLAAVLNKQLGLPLGKIATLFRERFGLTITPGGLVHAIRRAAHRAEPTYAALRARIRGSPVVTADETGWKVHAQLQWLWAAVTPDTTLYAIQPGRGFAEAATMLGADFDGVLVRDGWAPYRRFEQAVHQTCLAHLLRRCRTLIRDHQERSFAPRVQRILRHALRIRDRYQRGTVSAHGVGVARGHLQNQLNALIDRPGRARVAQRFAAHLAIEFPAVFTFLLEPDAIEATNWRAEHAIRPAVVARKVCGGNRSERGAHTHAVLASVLRTIQQRQLDAGEIFSELLRSAESITALATDERVRTPHSTETAPLAADRHRK